MKRLLLLLLLCLPLRGATQQWSIEHHRGLRDKANGVLDISLYGNRVFSHAFREPGRVYFPAKIPANAEVELVVTVTESEGAVWGSNPMGLDVPDVTPTLGLILKHDWHRTAGRWFSSARVPMTPGTHRLVVPVAPWAWVHVYGKPGSFSADNRRRWRETWGSFTNIGIAGGGHFFGKGFEVLSGRGGFRVLVLRVKP